MKAEIGMYEKALKELQYLIDTLRDEHQALQMAFNALEEKLRTTQVKMLIITHIFYLFECNDFPTHLLHG